MTPGKIIVVAIAIAVLGGLFWAVRPHSDPVRSAIEAEYERQDEAHRKRDIKAYVAVLAPDYIGRGAAGEIFSREQTEASMKSAMLRALEIRKVQTNVKRIVLQNGVALVNLHRITDANILDSFGTLGPTKARHDVVQEADLQDTWVNTPAGWKCKASQIMPGGTQSVDGKPWK